MRWVDDNLFEMEEVVGDELAVPHESPVVDQRGAHTAAVPARGTSEKRSN